MNEHEPRRRESRQAFPHAYRQPLPPSPAVSGETAGGQTKRHSREPVPAQAAAALQLALSRRDR